MPGEALLDRVQARLGDPAGVVDDDPAARGEHVDRRRRRRRAPPSRRAARSGELGAGEMAVAVGLRLVERVQHAGGEPVGRVERRVERARERVGGREADPVELADRVRLALQARDRAGAEVARDPPRRRGVDAVRVEKQAQLAQLALVAPGLHRAAEPPRADAGHAAQHALGVAVDRGEHLAGAVAVDEQRGAARADVLDGLQVGRDRRVADGLEDPHALDAELPAVARVAAPAAAGRDRLALAHVAERADEHDLLALVGDRVEHREVAVGQAPAHAHDLRDQLAGRGIAGRGVLLAVRHRASVACALDAPAVIGVSTHEMNYMTAEELEVCWEVRRMCACDQLRRVTRGVTQVYDNGVVPSGLRITQLPIFVGLASEGDCR